MPYAPLPGKARRISSGISSGAPSGTSTGSALVVVLFFVVLLSIVAIAFLARSLTAVKVSAGSAGETKSKFLATSASDTIIGDLKQEVIAGSTTSLFGQTGPNANTNAAAVAYPVYVPKSNRTAVPLMNGVPTSGSPATNAIPNMVSRSVSPANTSGAAPYVAYSASLYANNLTPPNRAASDPSATTYTSSKVNSATPSLNGRYVSPAQWNEHYLVPRNTTGSSTDSTPVSTFVPPDWVVVTRAGINSVSWSTGSGGLNDPTLTNSNFAVGRYGFAVYNEGGLLDMNAAGYPGTDSGSGSTGLTAAQIAYKNSLGLADLTQLTVGTTTLTQAQVNNIVGWRNYASSGPPTIGGTFGGFTFTQANASNWLTNFVTGNTNGYMQIVPTPSGVTTPPTDQIFLSRQQLIGVVQSLNIYPDFLQYMGTFTRAMEQPSYVANPNLPVIVGSSSPPDVSSVNNYQGNNTYWTGEYAINMRGTCGFLCPRVGATFTRLDGTTALAGEPLVKRKFALSRLALITTTYVPTFTSATAAAAANDPVYQRFGIYRTGLGSPWIYDHGIAAGGVVSSGTTTPAIIGSLGSVASLNGAVGTLNAPREPDFAELLKAAINAGSVGKAGPSGQGANDQYREDTSGDVQILKVMADLIDQQKTDNFPTWIQYTQTLASGSATRNVYGDQDLPNFYRWNYFGVTSQLPAPILATTDTVTVYSYTGTTTTGTYTLNHTRANATLSSTGSATLMIVPQIWNTHDANTPQVSVGPTQFRIVAATNNPGGTATTAWSLVTVPGTPVAGNNAVIHFDGITAANGPAFEYADCPTSGTATTTLNFPPTASVPATAIPYIQFTDGSAGKAFREPTILWRNNIPTNVMLTGSSVTDAVNPTNTYFGIVVGTIPAAWTWTDQKGTPYISQTSSLQVGADVPGGSGTLPSNIDFQMQYLNPYSSTWITYQESYVEYTLTDIPNYTLFVNKSEPAYASTFAYANPFASGVNAVGSPFSRQQSALFDPRSNRFSSPIAGSYTGDDPTLNGNPTLDASTLSGNQITSALNSAVATSNFVLMKTNRPTTARGQPWEYTTPCRGYDSTMHWYSSLSTCEYANGFNHSGADIDCFDGLLSQNNPAVKVLSNGTLGWNTTPTSSPASMPNGSAQNYYYEDADGIARRAMGGYVGVSGNPIGVGSNTTTTIGLPLATSGTVTTNGIVTPTTQSQSRPILLHRPFQSVAEMSYAFRGTPWKNVDFFTPESGDSALLDVFCINEPPSNAVVAGKVDLNTRQIPVLKAIFSAAYRDQLNNITTPPSGALPALSSNEAGNLASTLVGITTSQNAWEGPVSSVADIVGHFVYPDPGTLGATDVYQYTSPANSTEYTFSGFSAALSNTSIWDSANLTSTQNIQRFRESAIRPLAAAGQTRVWNLLVDIIAQSGHYPKTATGLDQFVVEGQTHLWVHVAIDRSTGQVIDKQVESVTP